MKSYIGGGTIEVISNDDPESRTWYHLQDSSDFASRNYSSRIKLCGSNAISSSTIPSASTENWLWQSSRDCSRLQAVLFVSAGKTFRLSI